MSLDNEAIGIAIHLSDLLEREFVSDKSGPCTMLAVKARKAAIEATRNLIDADPARPEIIRQLQSDIKRYTDVIKWMREIIADGKEAFQSIDEEERENVRRALGQEIDDQ